MMRWYRPIPCDNTVEKPMVCNISYLESAGYKVDSFLTGSPQKKWEPKLLYVSGNAKTSIAAYAKDGQ
jgi:hypothetical protein